MRTVQTMTADSKASRRLAVCQKDFPRPRRLSTSGGTAWQRIYSGWRYPPTFRAAIGNRLTDVWHRGWASPGRAGLKPVEANADG
jgi:hypothetical protein